VGQEVTVEILEVDLDRERVSLSLKATQEDPWQVFARTHAIGQVARARSPSSFRSVRSCASRTASRASCTSRSCPSKHVELAEQVVSVGEEVFVKVIDIDLERRRISLSLKQANESVDPDGTEFDPALYGMPPSTTRTASTSTPRASTPRPVPGRRASTLSARPGSRSTPLPRPLGGAQGAQGRRGRGRRRRRLRGAQSFSSDSAGAGTSPTTRPSRLCASLGRQRVAAFHQERAVTSPSGGWRPVPRLRVRAGRSASDV
jgi:small subunit ribosomal protein S1